MKYLHCLIITGIISVLFTAGECLHAAEVSTGTLVTAEISGISTNSLIVKDVDTNEEQSSVTWADQIVGSGWQMAQSYIELSVECNYYSWQIDIYTNNTTAETGFQKGGLLSTSTSTVRLPLGWLVSDSTVSIENVGEPGELIKNTVNSSTTTISASWTYVKDKNDKDDPNTSAWDESWGSANSSGYTTVLFGGSSSMSLAYKGISAVSPVVIYLEGEFLYIEGKMNYESTIFFDLFFQ